MIIFWHSCRDTLRSLLLPFLGCLVAGGLAITLLTSSADSQVQSYSGSWLHLPALLLAATGLAAAVDSWPLFSRDRPGQGWLQRIENQPTHGCVAAALGSATALGLGLSAVGMLFALTLVLANAAPEPLAARVTFEAKSSSGFLAPNQSVLRFETSQEAAIGRLVIRPTPLYLPGQTAPVDLTVHGDGQILHQGVLSNLGDRIDLKLDPPRRLRVVELRRHAGRGGVLRVSREDIEGLAPSGIPTWVNGLLASLSYLLPAALGLAIMVLGHHRLSLSVNVTAGLAVMLVATLTELTPNGHAIAAFARGHWLGGEELGSGVLLTLATVAGILALAWLPGRMGGNGQAWHSSSPASSPRP
ncbi:MAG: hypothetical protein VX951_03630 [Planctomycetota bacterium]|nr:hypothetical protein [Planctomycetota bacterium]